MKPSNGSVEQYFRWALIAPSLPISIWVSMMGLLGLGLGAGTLCLAYVLSTPAFFLNIISPRWGALGATGIAALDYLPRARLNWPEINPIVLLTSRADGMLMVNLVLSIASAVVWEVLRRRARTIRDHVPE